MPHSPRLSLPRLALLTFHGVVLLTSSASAQRDSTLTQAVAFDSLRLSSYSNQDLIALLSRPSLDLNLTASGGLVYVLPAHRLDSTPPSHDLSNPNRRSQVVNIDVQQASTLRYPNVVVSELVRRSARDDLLRAFSMSDDWAQLNWIEVTLSLLPSPHVDSTMIQLAKGGVQEEQGYLAVLYLAQEGRCWALEQLNRQYAKLPISSMEKVDVVALFSRYKYYPTAENLAETIEAMLVNLGDAALQALIIMYPSGRPNFDGPMAAQSYWKRYVAHHRRDSSASLCISNPVHK